MEVHRNSKQSQECDLMNIGVISTGTQNEYFADNCSSEVVIGIIN